MRNEDSGARLVSEPDFWCPFAPTLAKSRFKDFQLDSAAGVFRALCLIHRIAIVARCAGDLMHASMQGGHPVARSTLY